MVVQVAVMTHDVDVGLTTEDEQLIWDSFSRVCDEVQLLVATAEEEEDTIDALSQVDAKNKEKEALEKQIKNFEELCKSEEEKLIIQRRRNFEVPSSSSTDNPERLSLYFDDPPELH